MSGMSLSVIAITVINMPRGNADILGGGNR